MKRRSCLLLSLFWWALLLQGCSPSEADLAGECTVNFTAGMQMTGEWEPGEWVTRADESLAEGTTVRVLVYKGSSTAAANYLKECTYKVVSGALTRCAVNADGTVSSSGTAPAALTLIRGSYTFYAVSPAVTVSHAGSEPTASVTHGMDVAVAKPTASVTTASTTVPLSLTRFGCRLNFATDRVGTAVNKVVVQSLTLTDQAVMPKTLTGTTALANGVSSSSSVTLTGSVFVTDGTSAWKQTGHTLVLPKANGTFKLKVSAKINSLSAAKDYEVNLPTMAFAPAQAYNFTLKFNGIDMEVTQNDQWEEVPEGGDVFGNRYLSAKGTANCYIVTDNTAQEYSFNARVRGNGYESTTDPNVSGISYSTLPDLTRGIAARVVWQTGTDASTLLIYPASLRVESDKVYFKTTGKVNEGNAVIGIFASTDAAAPCLWSWHIWKLDGAAPGTVVGTKTSGTTGETVDVTMMDRNLGAFNNTPGDAGSIGLLYQWGRKDPFPGSKDWNTTEPSNIYGSWNNYGSTGSWPGTYSIKISNTNATIGTEAWAVKYPTAFIIQLNNPYDWMYTKNDNLWGTPWVAGGTGSYNKNQGTKSIYDPCPVGYRVPPQDTWSKQGTEKGSISNKGVIVSSFHSTLFFPAAGLRWGDYEYGKLENAGAYGYYWSSSPHGGNPERGGGMYFYSGGVSPQYTSYRANGFSVRCVSEQP